MFTKRSFKITLLGISLFALLALAGHDLGVLAALVTPTPRHGGLFTSPLPEPPSSLFDSPLPPPVVESYAQVALQYIAKREGISYTIAHHHRSDGTTCWGWSCWWAVNTTSTYPAPGDWLRQSFFAARGDLIRVAIAWWSEADPPPDYPTLGDDAFTSNFNLYVWDSDDDLLQSGYSASNRSEGRYLWEQRRRR